MTRKCEDWKYYDEILFSSLCLIYVTGILGNITIKIVLFWKGERSTVNKLLTVLAVWDTLFLGCLLGEALVAWSKWGWWVVIKDPGYIWISIRCFVYKDSGVIGGWCQQQSEWDTSDKYGTFENTTTTYIFYTLACIFQLASVYQTVLIAVFKCIAVIFPFKAITMCTGNRAMFATVVCLVFCVCVHVPSFLLTPQLQANHLALFKYLHWRSFFEGYHILFYNILVFFALPFITLVIINVIILRELWRSSSVQTNNAAEEENKAVTKVVVVVVTVFLVTYIVKPLYIVDIFYFKGTIISSFADISCTVYLIVHTLTYVLPTFNSVGNVFIYLLLRKSFRNQFLAMFTKNRNIELTELNQV